MGTSLYSFEFYPPKTPKGDEKLIKTAHELVALEPEFFSVTFGAGGSTREKTFETVCQLKEQTGINTAPHISCIGASKQSLKQMLDRYQQHGINRLVVLRGDKPAAEDPLVSDFQYAYELVAFIKEQYGDQFTIEVACYPETHPESSNAQDDFQHFVEKVQAGADSAITQYFYNADSYQRFLDKCQQAGIDIPIVPGIMPITNFVKLVQFSKGCGAEIPQWLYKELTALQDSPEALIGFGIDFVSHMCDNLLHAGAPSLHFYTLNDAKVTLDICKQLESIRQKSKSTKNIRI